MIRREVLVRVRDDRPVELIDRAFEATRQLALDIPSVQFAIWGRNKLGTHALLVIGVPDSISLDEYQRHPNLARMVMLVRSIASDFSVADFEVPD